MGEITCTFTSYLSTHAPKCTMPNSKFYRFKLIQFSYLLYRCRARNCSTTACIFAPARVLSRTQY
jgi:hypothetical protein